MLSGCWNFLDVEKNCWAWTLVSGSMVLSCVVMPALEPRGGMLEIGDGYELGVTP